MGTLLIHSPVYHPDPAGQGACGNPHNIAQILMGIHPFENFGWLEAGCSKWGVVFAHLGHSSPLSLMMIMSASSVLTLAVAFDLLTSAVSSHR